MKYLKIFELYVADPNSKKFSEEDYQDLIDTLQVELFDEHNIHELKEEDYDEYHDNENTYPYWEYSYNIDGSIRQINIAQLTKEQIREFTKELLHYLPSIIKNRSGLRYQCDTFIEDDINYLRIYLV